MTSREANSALSELSGGDGAIGEWVTDRVNRAKCTTVLGVGAVFGAVAGAATAMRPTSEPFVRASYVIIPIGLAGLPMGLVEAVYRECAE